MAGKIQNQDIKSAAELVSAGATAASLPNDDKIYVTALSINKTLKQAIIDGDIGGGGAPVEQTSQSISGGGTISVTEDNAIIPVAGNAGAQVASTTPFGAGPFTAGQTIELIGTDNDNTLEITYNDAANGCVGNFASIILARYEKARFIYSGVLSRFVGGKL